MAVRKKRKDDVGWEEVERRLVEEVEREGGPKMLKKAREVEAEQAR